MKSIESSVSLVNCYLGLSLGGAKSDKTCLTVIHYYPKQQKAFVIENHTSLAATQTESADEVLLKILKNYENYLKVLACDAPLTLPPCLTECEKECPGYQHCKKSEVRWMHREYLKAKKKHSKLKFFTPYSQRPVDLYFRYKHMDCNLFQDETLGANLAPQTARMAYLKRYLDSSKLIEVWPKLALFYLSKKLKLSKKNVLSYRTIESGAEDRAKVIEILSQNANLFIYDKDQKHFIENMSAFDSLLCAWTAMQYDLDQVEKFKQPLPLESGWVQIPSL